jgi:hypothetical protein
MRTTKSIFLLIGLLLAASLVSPENLAAAADEKVILSEVHDFQGEQIHSVTLREAQEMVVWDPATEDAPLSLSKAIQAAKTWLKSKQLNEKATLGHIQLQTPFARGMDNKWYYILSYYIPPVPPSDFPRDIRVVVLMNGKVVETGGK